MYVGREQYMDRIYVKHQNKAPVNEVGLQLWLTVVVQNRTIRERMLTIMLDMVKKERNGEIIGRSLMRSITTVSLLP
jgi:cullin 3